MRLGLAVSVRAGVLRAPAVRASRRGTSRMNSACAPGVECACAGLHVPCLCDGSEMILAWGCVQDMGHAERSGIISPGGIEHGWEVHLSRASFSRKMWNVRGASANASTVYVRACCTPAGRPAIQRTDQERGAQSRPGEGELEACSPASRLV